MQKTYEISPSILSADFADLAKELKILNESPIKRIHLDVMDGHFVPNITFGPPLIKSIRKKTDLILEAHLMIKSPEKYLKQFTEVGSDIIIIHKETVADPLTLIKEIRALGKVPGVSINPATPWQEIKDLLKYVDLVLVMTVVPGFGGQKFMQEVMPKLKELKEYVDKNDLNVDIEVDGGINTDTINIAKQNGANIFVAGNSVFSKPDVLKAIKELKAIIV